MTIKARPKWFFGIPAGREREVFPHAKLPVGVVFTNPKTDWEPVGGVLFVADSAKAKFQLNGGAFTYKSEDINKARITSGRNFLGVCEAISYRDDSSVPLKQYFEKTLSGVGSTDPRAQAFYDALVFGNIYFNTEAHNEVLPGGFKEQFEADCLSRGEKDKEYARAFGWFRKLISEIDYRSSFVLSQLNYLGEVKYGVNGFSYFKERLYGFSPVQE